MADSIEFKLNGLEELLGKIESIDNDLRYKGGRFALRKATQIIVDKAKQEVLKIDDRETGRVIADNIAMRWSGKRFRRTGDLMFRVGVLSGKIKMAKKGNPDEGKGGATPHAMLVELGTVKSKAHPYLRPSAINNGQAIVDEFILQYSKSIDRAIRRARKKAAQ